MWNQDYEKHVLGGACPSKTSHLSSIPSCQTYPAHAKFWNTGHSFQAFEGGVDPSRGRLHVRGRAYDFEQLHFHVPSENLLDGRRYAMEAHLVHSSGSSLAVLAILFEVGACNAFLDKFWERFPDDGTTGAEGAAKGVT